MLLAVNIPQNSHTLCESWQKHTPPSSKYSCQKNLAWICSSLYLTTHAENRGLVQHPMRCSQQNPKLGNCRINYPFFPHQNNCKKRKKKKRKGNLLSKEYADTFQPITMRGLHLDSNSNNVLKKKREKRKEQWMTFMKQNSGYLLDNWYYWLIFRCDTVIIVIY